MEYLKIIIQFLGFGSIVVLIIQFANTNRWKKLEYSLNSQWNSNIEKAKTEFESEYPEGLFEYNKESISDNELLFIINNEKAKVLLIKLLNSLEDLACLINLNALDKKYCYSMFGEEITGNFSYFSPFIEWYRNERNDFGYYSDLEEVAKKWKTRNIKSKALPSRKIENRIGYKEET